MKRLAFLLNRIIRPVLSVVPVYTLRDKLLLCLLVGAMTMYIVYLQHKEHGWNWKSWDLLLVSGLVLYIFCYLQTLRFPAFFNLAIRRLYRRGMLLIPDNDVERLLDEIHQQAITWSKVGAILNLTLIAIVFVAAIKIAGTASLALVGAIETLLAFIIGYQIGMMFYYSQLSRILRVKSVQIYADPRHPDKTGGLKPLGELFFQQTVLFFLPSMFVAFWIVIIAKTKDRYDFWMIPYIGLFIISIVVQLIVFLLPLLAFHKTMLQDKLRWESDVDNLYAETSAKHNLDADNAKRIHTLYEQVSSMPTWPIDLWIKLKFIGRNLVLVIPVLFAFFNEEITFQQIGDLFSALFSED